MAKPKHNFNFWPEGVLIVLMVLVVACFICAIVSSATIYQNVTSDTLITDISSRPLVSIPMLAAGIAIITIAVLGWVNIISRHLNFLILFATIGSSLLILMIVLELVFSH